VIVEGNNFNYGYLGGINIPTNSSCNGAQCAVKGLKLVGNNFVTSPHHDYGGLDDGYSCTNNNAVAVGSPIQDSVISGNTFNMSHISDITAGPSSQFTNVLISNNAFHGACEQNECDDTGCAESVKGQQGDAIQIESSVASVNLTISNNSFNSPGYYAVEVPDGANLINNSCNNPFTNGGPPSNNYKNGCFTYPGPSAAGSVAMGNYTSSTSSAAVVAWNGATNVRFSGNRSAWTGTGAGDVIVAGSGAQIFSSWNERITNAGGATVYSSLDPATGNVFLGGTLTLSSQAPNGGQVVCFKSGVSAGQLGYCSGPVMPNGSCTCN
jgi:hypothetical protein